MVSTVAGKRVGCRVWGTDFTVRAEPPSLTMSSTQRGRCRDWSGDSGGSGVVMEEEVFFVAVVVVLVFIDEFDEVVCPVKETAAAAI